MPSEHPQLNKALKPLEEAIASGRWGDGERFPPIRVLARELRTSPLAVSKALRTLADSGRITIVPYKGVFLGSQRPPPNITVESVGSAWEKARRALETDILGGRLPRGKSLPSRLELCSRYGISHPTLRKALEALRKEGLLIRNAEGFLVSPLPKATAHASVLLTSLGNDRGKITIPGPRYREFLETLRRGCYEQNVKLVVLPWFPDQNISRYLERLHTMRSKHVFIGYVLWTAGVEPTAAELILKTQIEAGRPVAAVDETGEQTFSSLNPSRFRLFRLSGVEAGAKAARHLIDHGHRKIGYLSLFHAEPWSRRRWRGINETVSALGKEAHAQLRVLEEKDALENVSLELPPRFQKTWNGFEVGLKSIYEYSRLHSCNFMCEQIFGNVWAWKREFMVVETLGRLLKGIEKVPEVTAWICGNDFMAHCLKEYFSRIRISVPKRLSVMGFDDVPHSEDQDLTSFNFGFNAIAQSVLSYLLHPQGVEGKSVVIEGFGHVVVRGSTGPRKSV